MPQVANGKTAIGEFPCESLHPRPRSVIGQGRREFGVGLPEIPLEHSPQFRLGSIDGEDHFDSVRRHCVIRVLYWNRLLVLQRGFVLHLPARRSSIAFDVGVTDRPPFAVQHSSCGIAFPTSYIAWITSSNGIRC